MSALLPFNGIHTKPEYFDSRLLSHLASLLPMYTEEDVASNKRKLAIQNMITQIACKILHVHVDTC